MRTDAGWLALEEVATRVAAELGDRREAEELLALVHDKPRYWVRESGDARLDAGAVSRSMEAARRRKAGAPIQYAARRAAFRHLDLHVDERVLIPRPETEVLVDIVLSRVADRAGGVLVDVGTGSGALALSLASEGRFDRVIATDVSLDALAVASLNADALGVGVEFRHGSVLQPVGERGVRAIVSNPPYISFEEATALPSAVRDWEPAVALFSPDDGMEMTTQLVCEAAAVLAPRGLLAMEVDMRRAARVARLCSSHGAYDEVAVLLDLTGRERFVVATRREDVG